MSVQVEIVDVAGDEVVDALNGLLPQLSSTAAVVTSDQLRELVESSEAISWRDERSRVGTLTSAGFPFLPDCAGGSKTWWSMKGREAPASAKPSPGPRSMKPSVAASVPST